MDIRGKIDVECYDHGAEIISKLIGGCRCEDARLLRIGAQITDLCLIWVQRTLVYGLGGAQTTHKKGPRLGAFWNEGLGGAETTRCPIYVLPFGRPIKRSL